jgi:hypothetical protein
VELRSQAFRLAEEEELSEILSGATLNARAIVRKVKATRQALGSYKGEGCYSWVWGLI